MQERETSATIGSIACDYVDVVRDEGGQPRFIFQPHLSGGAVGAPSFSLEIEGARALVQHLSALIREAGASR